MVSLCCAQLSQWERLETGLTKPSGRYTASLTLVSNTHLYLIGGSRDEQLFNSTWRYDIVQSTWQDLQPSATCGPQCPPGWLSLNASTCYRNETIVIPSNSSSSNTTAANSTTIQVLTPLIEVCDSSTVFPALAGHTATLVDDVIVVIGGRQLADEFHNHIHVYNITANRWTRRPSAPVLFTEVYGHTAVWHASTRRVLVYGGIRPYHGRYAEAFDDLHAYHVDHDQWVEVGVRSRRTVVGVDNYCCVDCSTD
jgi:N-acetylneuraminic acid mutarotase